jgi:hypothetical protein
MMAARSANAATPPRKAVDCEATTSRATPCSQSAGGAPAVEIDASPGGGRHNAENDEHQYRKAVDFLRDFHLRSQTLDVIYEEEGRDPCAASRPSQGGTGGGASHRMLKVRTTGSLLDLVPADDDEVLGESRPADRRQKQQQQQQRESPAMLPSSESKTHDDNSHDANAAMEWGHFGDDDDQTCSGVSEESGSHRTMRGMASRRILYSSCHPRFNAHRPCRRRHQPRRHVQQHFPEKDWPSI